jgi:hypothetical protein
MVDFSQLSDILRNRSTIGLLTVFIATFMLFYIFSTLSAISDACIMDVASSDLCPKLAEPTMDMVLVVVIVSWFVISIIGTGYLLLFPKDSTQ